MRKRSESQGASAAPPEGEASAAAPDAPHKDQGEEVQKEEGEDDDDDVKVTMVGGEVVWDLGNYSSKIAGICTPAKAASHGDGGKDGKVAADDDEGKTKEEGEEEEDAVESMPNLGLRGGGGNDDDDDDGDVAFSSHSDMSGGGEPGAGVGMIDGDDDDEGQGDCPSSLLKPPNARDIFLPPSTLPRVFNSNVHMFACSCSGRLLSRSCS